MTISSIHAGRQRAAWLLATLLLLPLVGCGQRVGSVSGKVLYKGQPLKGGNVTFLGQPGKDPNSAASAIKEDGSYRIDRIAAGPVKVVVETKSLLGPGGGGGPPSGPPKDAKFPEGYPGTDFKGMAARYVKIPDNYANPEQTDLKYEVKPGDQDITIELK
jgi:hypothetical protein